MQIREQETLGVWGLGVVGTSYVSHLRAVYPHHDIIVHDIRTVTEDDVQFLRRYNASYFEGTTEAFLAQCDRVFVSPGIVTRAYTHHKNKLYGELDIAGSLLTMPTCAITGTLGKTTVVTLLTSMLARSMHAVSAGNIGVPILEAINHDADTYVFELSSFQLSYNKTYAPDVAVITNVYPNHLDWHASFEEYVHAKAQICAQNMSHQSLVVSCQLFDENVLPVFYDAWRACRARKLVVCVHDPAHLDACIWAEADEVITYDGQVVSHYAHTAHTAHTRDALIRQYHCTFDQSTCQENWLSVYAALYAYGYPVHGIHDFGSELSALEHRLEKCGTINGAHVYNDSKSTVIEATRHAIDELARRYTRLHVLVGGVSKGVDRRVHIEKLRHNPVVVRMVCFGRECDQFSSIEGYSTLPDAFAAIVKNVRAGDAIVFSPGGASFDLFTHYQERGMRFKEMVEQYEG